jgi:ribosome biogenesis GTPase
MRESRFVFPPSPLSAFEDKTLTLESFGWNSHFARTFAAQASAGQRPGRIVTNHGADCLVWTEDGEVRTPLAGAMRNNLGLRPVAGDWAVLRADADVICGILKRRTELARAVAGHDMPAQVLAANIDVLLIVTGLDGDFNPRRIERFLVLAAEAGIDPVIVLSKADLCSKVRLDEAIALTRESAPGVPVIPWSAVSGQDPGVIAGCVEKGQTAAVAGSSGAGKSTLINRLLDEERLETREVRASDSRGRHTTVRRELIALRQGWVVADLPGLRSVGLWASGEAVAEVFEELDVMRRQCRYRNCTHTTEPGCALREAVEAGDVAGGRLENFGKLSRETAFSQQAKKQWEKTIARAMRQRTKAGFDLKK